MSHQRPENTMEITYSRKALLEAKRDLEVQHNGHKEDLFKFKCMDKHRKASAGDAKLELELLEKQTPRPTKSIEEVKRRIKNLIQDRNIATMLKEKSHYLMKSTEREYKELQTTIDNLNPTEEKEKTISK